MTIDELKNSNRILVDAEDVAEVLGVNPQSIRGQAHLDPRFLGFRVIVIGRRTMIPRKPFLEYITGEASE
jgi:hypothetical protein